MQTFCLIIYAYYYQTKKSTLASVSLNGAPDEGLRCEQKKVTKCHVFREILRLNIELSYFFIFRFLRWC